MKINLLPKKRFWQVTNKTLHIVAGLAMVFNMSMVGVFIAPNVAQAAETGYLNPSANAADTGGDGDGFESNPTGAYTDGSGNAANNNGAGDRHRFYNYGANAGIPVGSTIDGIEVRLDWWLSWSSGSNSMSVNLSWDGGSSWTNLKTTSGEPTSQTTSVLGGTSDTWDRSWTVDELSDANFRVRITSNSSRSTRDFYVDWIAVKVHYTEAEKVCPAGNVKYEIGSGYEYDDGSATITGDGDSVTWTAADGFIITGVCIKIGGPGGGSLINPDPADGSGGPYAYDISHVVVTTEEEPEECELEIVKTVDEATADPGDTLHYRLDFENVGDANCTGGGVKVKDVLDSNLTYSTESHSTNVDFGYGSTPGHVSGTLLWNADTLTPGESGWVTFEAVVGQFEPCTDIDIPNQGNIWSNETGWLDSNIVYTNITTECTYCGDGIKQSPNDVGTGGPQDDGYEACDGTDGVGAHQSCTQECTLEDLTYCGDGTKQTPNDEGTGGPQNDGNEACDGTDGVGFNQECTAECTITDLTCDLEITKSVDKQTAVPGDTLTYTLDYINNGDGICTGTGVKVYDHLDSQITYVNATRSIQIFNDDESDGYHATEGNNYNGTTNNLLYNVNRVSPGESGTITFDVTVNDFEGCGEKRIPNRGKIWSNQTGFIWSNYVHTTANKDCEGDIKVNKEVDTNGDGTFDGGNTEAASLGFVWGLDSETPARAMGSDETVLTGSYDVTENNVDGYHFVGWYTNDSDYTCETTTFHSLPANVLVTDSETSEITLCNARDTGDLLIKKYNDLNENGEWNEGEPMLEGWEFNVSQNATSKGGGTTDANGELLITGLPTGDYDVTESLEGKWLNTTNLTQSATIVTGQTTTVMFGNAVETVTLDLDKSNDKNVVGPEETINYRVDWSIAGNSTAVNVVLTDRLPAEVVLDVSSISNGGTYDATEHMITWNFGNQEPGASGFVTYTVTTIDTLENGTVLINVARIAADNTDPKYKEDDTTIIVEVAPILTIEKEVNKVWVNPGDEVTYTVTVANIGDGTAYNVELTDLLPANFTFVDYATGTHTFSLGDMLPGDSITTTYKVTVGEDVEAGEYDNYAVASADNHENVDDQVTVEVRIPSVLAEEAYPNLVLVKTIDKEFINQGESVTYTLTISNTGDASALAVAVNVHVQDVLPAGFTFEDGEVTKIWALGDIKEGESKSITYTAISDTTILPGNYENLAVAWADNHERVTDSVDVDVREILVLGEELPITGGGFMNFLYGLIAVLVLGFAAYVLRLTTSKERS